MTRMRSLIMGVILTAGLAGPVSAQMQQESDKTPLQKEEEARRKEAIAIDKQYKATLDRIKRNETKTETRASDPWSNMRGTDDSKTKR